MLKHDYINYVSWGNGLGNSTVNEPFRNWQSLNFLLRNFLSISRKISNIAFTCESLIIFDKEQENVITPWKCSIIWCSPPPQAHVRSPATKPPSSNRPRNVATCGYLAPCWRLLGSKRVVFRAKVGPRTFKPPAAAHSICSAHSWRPDSNTWTNELVTPATRSSQLGTFLCLRPPTTQIVSGENGARVALRSQVWSHLHEHGPNPVWQLHVWT